MADEMSSYLQHLTMINCIFELWAKIKISFFELILYGILSQQWKKSIDFYIQFNNMLMHVYVFIIMMIIFLSENYALVNMI